MQIRPFILYLIMMVLTVMLTACQSTHNAKPNLAQPIQVYSYTTTRITIIEKYFIVGNQTASIDARNAKTDVVYDALNRMVLQTDPEDADGNRSSQTFTYDQQDNLISTTDRRSITTTNTYDQENRLTRSSRSGVMQIEQVYDGVGNIAQISDAENNTIVYRYNDANELVQEIRPLGFVVSLERDVMGDVIDEQRPAGRNIERIYDQRRRLSNETRASTETTTFGYDANGNRTRITRPKALGDWDFVFDDADRLITATDPLSNRWNYVYDGNGNRVSSTDPNGHQTQMSYDALNRLSSISYPDSSQESFDYDANGNLSSRIDANGQTISHIYDSRNRLVNTNYSAASGNQIESESYVYDANSNLEQITLTTAAGQTRTSVQQYDSFDRLEIITDRYGNQLQYGYDDNGNRRQLIDHQGRITQYIYDGLNRLASITAPLAGQVVYDYFNNNQLRQINWPNGTQSNYQYDGAERLQQIDHQLAGNPFASVSYQYDSNGNRAQQIITQATQSQTTQYDYDNADRLRQIIEPDRSIDYILDGTANRTNEAITDSNNQLIADKTYIYNDADQLTQVTDSITNEATTYSYDPNGNQTQKTDNTGTTNYSYGPRNRLLTITLPGAPPINYTYNDQGLRDSQSQAGQETRYIYDTTALIAETNVPGTELARYTHSTLGLIAEARNNIQTYIHGDALNTPIVITDIGGAVTTRYTWDTWGKLQQQTGASEQPFGFTGYQYDQQTGLHYAQQRYYDNETGRFNRHDPFRGETSQPLSLHRYLYANANPTVFIDPDGRRPCESVRCELARLQANANTRQEQERFGQMLEEANQILTANNAQSAAFLLGGFDIAVDALAETAQLAGDLSGSAFETVSGGFIDFGGTQRINQRFIDALDFVTNDPIGTSQLALADQLDLIDQLEQSGDAVQANRLRGQLFFGAGSIALSAPSAARSITRVVPGSSTRSNVLPDPAQPLPLNVVENSANPGAAVELAFESNAIRERILGNIDESAQARAANNLDGGLSFVSVSANRNTVRRIIFERQHRSGRSVAEATKSTPQILKNGVQGDLGEAAVRQRLLNNNSVELIGEQVRIRTPGVGSFRVTDFLVRGKNTGQLRIIEVKTGGATRNASQLGKDALIANPQGATTFFGRRARGAGFSNGTPTGPVRTFEVNASNLNR